MSVPQNIQELANKVRNEIYGRDVRESIAKSMEATGEVAEWSRQVAQDIVDGKFDEGELATEIERKLNDLETQYAPELNSVKTDLAQTAKRVDLTNQMNFYDFHEKNYNPSQHNLFSVLSDRRFEFEVGITENESIKYDFRKNGNDDFIKFRTGTLLDIGKTEVKEDFLPSNVSDGSLVGLDSENPYATTIGTKITHTFHGSYLYFNHYTNDRGGVWEFRIDGVLVNTLSTHVNGVPSEDLILNTLAQRLVVDNLSDEEHTLVMTFIGDDEEHEPSSGVGTSRGWTRVNKGTSGNPLGNVETFAYEATSSRETEVISDSNKEFAFSAKVLGSSHSSQWFPDHNNIGTAFIGSSGYQEMYVDGERVNLSSTVSKQPFEEIKMVQKLEYIHPDSSNPLGVILITTTINSKGILFYSKMEWLQDVEISSGYVNMMTVNSAFGKELITSLGGVYSLDIFDNSNEDISEPAPTGFVVVNRDDFPNFYHSMQVIEPLESLRLDEDGRRGESDGTNLYFLQHRNERLQKLYPYIYNSHVANAGDIYRFSVHYGFGKHPRVADLFS